MTGLLNRFVPALVACLAVSSTAMAQDIDVWSDLRTQVFGTTAIAEEDGTLSLDAPVRADDAALVPLTITMPQGKTAKTLTLIIDQNPVPVAAKFIFGPAAGEKTRKLTTRVRIDRYSFVRAIVETEDGKLHMATKFVKASGGCSAPAGKDTDAALAEAGKMQIKPAVGKAGDSNEAQVMIKHPNFTGMQMDQVSRNFTPARFISEMDVTSNGELVFRMESGISISENPHFRFSYPAGGKGTIEVVAKDSSGAVYSGKSHSDGS